MSLRARLLLGLVALVSVGLAVAAVVTYEEQRSFLFARVDQQVVASELPVAVRLGDVLPRFPVAGKPPPASSQKPPGGTAATFQASGTYGVLVGAGGRILQSHSFTYGQRAASPPALPSSFPVSRFGSSRTHLFTVNSKSSSGLRYRVAAFSVSDGRILVVAVPLREVDQTLGRLVVVELLVGSGVVLALVALGWMVIRLGLRPLERIGRVAADFAHGNLSRRVGLTNPRTEVGRLGVSLNEMLMQVEQAFADRQESEDRLRQFLADASHELRTPLAAIRGYAEAFRLGAATDPTTLERAMARIEAETTRMGVLVDDLLLLASLDELPEKEPVLVDLRELVEHAAHDARAIAPTRQIDADASGPVPVLADADQLRQVLANLVRNALIHTPEGSAIELSARAVAADGVIEVRDHGPGLPAGSVDRVFDRFWRTEGGRRRGRGGAGLGLAIVKAIVNAHQGKVEVRNAADGGAVFRVTLPLVVTHAPAPAAEPTRGRSQIPMLN